jgi:flagellar hook-associated protein 2
MASSVTMSGFNSIDWNTILNLVMQQESQPLNTLKTQQTGLKSQSTTYATLATKLSAFESAVADLADTDSLLGRTTTNSDTSAVSVSATSSAPVGSYDIVVKDLAKSQVTASASTTPDADETVVASGGTLKIGDVTVTVDTAMTLQQLAAKINDTEDIGVSASVVKSGTDAWRLVLTSTSSGTEGAFTVTNSLTGGTGVSFTDTDHNGISGDSDEDNAVIATDAKALINNIEVVSSTNTLTDAISGVTVTLLKKDETKTVSVGVEEDLGSAKDKINALVTAYNDLVSFSDSQNALAAKNDKSSIARDPLLRGLRNELRHALSSNYAPGGGHNSLASIGIEFEKTGKISFDASAFSDAMSDSRADVMNLFAGSGDDEGVFSALDTLVKSYTDSDGLLADMQDRLDDQVTRLSSRIDDLSERLEVRRAALQKEYIAADMTMTQLNNAVGSLSSLSKSYSSF